ncbi:hypothetical protein [Terricaulis silvestris]|uniref:Uncharacterized protein n=1 Tax=Terricaulis silvestris TaxID=2686094 RepID=A0A6I6MJN8_9CAUL|nr:hypothetical protein [Terricaulis silvestris]QGZ93266.1 hypothetical protein DSM104635_00074 [Terricaulis silvestris]
MRTASEVAAYASLMFIEFAQPRMRVSERTLRVIGKRTYLRDAHLAEVDEALRELGLTMVRTDRGFVVLKVQGLESAKAYTFKSFKNSRAWPQIDQNHPESVWALALGMLETDPSEEDEQS